MRTEAYLAYAAGTKDAAQRSIRTFYKAVKDDIEVAKQKRRRRIWKYVEEPMTKPTKMAL